MSQNVNEFNYETNDDFFEMESPQNDESIESENDFANNILSDKLCYNINKKSKSNDKANSFISYGSEISSSSKKDNSIENIEQINEVKYKFFMIMKNKCSYNGEYNKIFSLKSKKYEIKLRRLVIQKMSIVSKNEIIYGKKDYIFIPINNNEVEFDYEIGENRKFKIDIRKNETKITCGKIELANEEKFKKDYPEIEEEIPKEKKNKIKQNDEKKENKLKENNIDEKQKLSDNNINKNKDDTKSEKNEQNKRIYPLIDDNSEDEVKQKYKYYLHQESNIFYRFVYCNNYVKEFDDIYTTNCEIKLNIKGEIKFDGKYREKL